MQHNEEKAIQEQEANSDPARTGLQQDVISGNTEETQDELQEEEDYSGLSKPALLAKLKELAAADEASAVTRNIFKIKDTYRSLVKEEFEFKQREYISEGGEKDDFVGVKDPLDDQFEELIKQFNKKRSEQKKQKEKALQENLAKKQQVIGELKTLIESGTGIGRSFERLQELQAIWRETGPVAPAYANELWQNYKHYLDQFFNNIQISRELRELDLKKNLELKTELCEKAEALKEEPSLKKALNDLKALQDKWREIGQVPKEENEKIWERFKAAADKIYERRKEHLESLKKQREENLIAKTTLCEKVDALANEDLNSHKAWQEANARLEQVWTEWQKIGFVPKNDNGKTWKRFKEARQAFYNKRESFYAKSREEQNENLKQKTALCEQAEALQNSTDWNETANKLKGLQREWKNTGPVSRKYSDKIWNRFRKACDTFFENKAKQQAEAEAHLNQNVKTREEFITRVEQTALTEDNKQNLEALKNLQNEWSALGEVPATEKDRLNKQYQQAIKSVINKIKEQTGDDKLYDRLRYEQLNQSPQGKEQLRKERQELQGKIKKLEAEIIQLENNLGFFGSSKNNSLLEEYRQKIENGRNEVKVLTDKLKQMPREEQKEEEPEPVNKKNKRGHTKRF